MTKEEKIKEAWGIAYDDVKGMLIENGYIASIDLAHSSLNLSVFGLNLTYNNIGVRPVSLQGIENNNGWIKIESEEDLPKEVINCWFATNNGIYLGYYTTRGYFVNEGEDIELKFITHYQPIEKPKPPLY